MTKLRMVEASDIEILDRQRTDAEAAGEHNWHGYRAVGRLAREVADGELVRADGGLLAIADESGRTVGDVSWRSVLNGPPPHGECWEIGIWITPEGRGQGHGAAAQRQLAEYLFAYTKLERIQATTEIGNLAEQKALEKAGFTREGVLRRACFRAGDWRDMVMFSKLRNET
ncbi:MAG TPA: GNAT family protein [Mycobacteriales bacterium]|nr:GNAT family protein [Mycobacteriales bacterium]